MVLTFFGHPAYNPLWLTDQKMFSNKIAPFTKSFNRTVIPVFTFLYLYALIQVKKTRSTLFHFNLAPCLKKKLLRQTLNKTHN